MKRVLIGMTVAYMLVGISACALLGAGVSEKARVGAQYSMTMYAYVWQPALKVYGELKTCEEPAVAPCKDRALYSKLYKIDGAIAECAPAAVKALAENQDYSGLVKCMEKVEEAKIEFAKAGIVQ